MIKPVKKLDIVYTETEGLVAINAKKYSYCKKKQQ